MMKRFASQGGSVRPRTRCQESMRKHRGIRRRDPKMRIINDISRRIISEIKLKRTDTTLDLSQMAKRAEEKEKEKARRMARRQILIGNREALAEGGGELEWR